ncbi:hypothetical protein [Algivirga pacifica]|uniref:Lipocalin-like domain-containing protein n=1 Tax=Algivirga pacifica TaxID=1162670 RepID=A0ABP9DID3_9BACT
MKRILRLITALTLFMATIACDVSKNTQQTDQVLLKGTWKLVSNTIIQGEEVKVHSLEDNEMIKMFNEDHFAFFNHSKGHIPDSVRFFTAGSGPYTLKGNTYEEKLDYCSAKSWEGLSFTFQMEVKGDTLIQSGEEVVEEEGINRKIIEKYVRVH